MSPTSAICPERLVSGNCKVLKNVKKETKQRPLYTYEYHTTNNHQHGLVVSEFLCGLPNAPGRLTFLQKCSAPWNFGKN